MALDLWMAFVAATIAMLLIPGPTVMLILSYALSQGRRVAVATALGVGLGDFVAMTASLLGLGALLLASATAFTVLKFVGAAYLIYLGIKLLRSEPTPLEAEDMPEVPPRAVFAHAFGVTALNPKGIAFFVAFVPQFINPAGPILAQTSILIATFVTLATLNALAYALLADRLRVRIKRPSVLRWINRLGGGSLITMGAATAALRS